MYFSWLSLNHKGYKCLEPNGKIIVSRNVIFDELSFPFAKNTIGNTSQSSDNANASVSTLKVPIPSSVSRDTETLTQQHPPTISSEDLTPSLSSPSIGQPAEPPVSPVNTHSIQTRIIWNV